MGKVTVQDICNNMDLVFKDKRLKSTVVKKIKSVVWKNKRKYVPPVAIVQIRAIISEGLKKQSDVITADREELFSNFQGRLLPNPEYKKDGWQDRCDKIFEVLKDLPPVKKHIPRLVPRKLKPSPLLKQYSA